MDSHEFEASFGSLAKADAPVEELPDPVGINWEVVEKSPAATRNNVTKVLREYFVKDCAGDFCFESPTDKALRKLKANGIDLNQALAKRASGNVLVKFADGREMLNPTYNRADDSWKLGDVIYRGEVVEIEMQEV
jgi:hypothetical protein